MFCGRHPGEWSASEPPQFRRRGLYKIMLELLAQVGVVLGRRALDYMAHRAFARHLVGTGFDGPLAKFPLTLAVNCPHRPRGLLGFVVAAAAAGKASYGDGPWHSRDGPTLPASGQSASGQRRGSRGEADEGTGASEHDGIEETSVQYFCRCGRADATRICLTSEERRALKGESQSRVSGNCKVPSSTYLERRWRSWRRRLVLDT